MKKYITPKTDSFVIRTENNIMSAGVNRNDVIDPLWDWDEEE